jgi:hypothetical protein
MPVFTVSSARPRQELAMAIVEGQNRVSDLIGNKILPQFPVTRRTAHIIKATLADTLGLRIIAADKFIHAPGTKFERAVAKFGDDTMTVTLRGQEIVVPNEVKLDYAEYLSVEQFFAGRFGETAALTNEYLVQAAIFNTTNFGSATNSTVAYTAALLSTNSFISDVIASIRRVKAKGEIPDTVAMSGPVFERIRQAATVQGYVAGTLKPGQEATLNTIQMALAEYGIKQVLVGDSYYNTAADGATPSLSQIWSNTYIWVGKAGNVGEASGEAGLGVPTLGGVGANVFWEGYVGGLPSTDTVATPFAGGNFVESYPDLSIDSMIVRVKMSNLPYIGNARGGDLIATQYS